MDKVTGKTEYHIHRFMYALGIKGSALAVYAALYSFSMGERGVYHGSQKYLAESIGVSVRTVQNALTRLFSLGLIERYRTPDGRYKGIRCADPGAEREKKDSLPSVNTEAPDCARENEKGESESSLRGGAEPSDKGMGRLERVDRLCAEMQEKIKRMNAEREERRIALEISEAATSQEKNTLLMMQRYEKSGDNRRFLDFGKAGRVKMTEPQYKRLLDLLPTEELMPYLVRFEAMLSDNEKTGKSPPHSHYKTLKKWIEEDLAL